MKRSHILLKNITSNFLTQFWLLSIGFITTPIIFHKLGSGKYGLLILLYTIPAYLSVLDIGIISALVKNISELKNTKDFNNIIKTAFFGYLFIVFFWSILIFFISTFLVQKILKIPPSLMTLAIITFKLVSINFIFISLGTFFSSISQGLQKFEIYNIKNLITGTFIPLGSILLLVFNKGLKEIIYLNIFINFFIAILFYIISKKILPQRNTSFKFSFLSLKKLLSFGIFKFITNLNSQVVFQLNQFLIAVFSPIGLVSFYAVPSRLTQKIISFLPNLTSPIFPLASELNSLSLKQKLKKLYINSIKIANIIIFPLIIFLFFYSHTILKFWIGKEFANQASLILKILSIAYLLNSFSAIPATITEGLGKPKITTFFSSLSAILYLILAFLLIPKFKIVGAALAILVNACIQVPIFVYFVSVKIIKIKKMSFYFNNYFKPALLTILIIIPWKFISFLINSLWQLSFIFISYLLTYIALVLFTKTLNKKDKIILKNFLIRFYFYVFSRKPKIRPLA